MDKDKVYVLHWEYTDKSGSGIEKVYHVEQDAIDDFELLVKYDPVRNWFIDPYPIK